MITVQQCWDAYVSGHLSKTVKPVVNEKYWGRLAWFKDADASTPLEVERYITERTTQDGVIAATLNRELALLRAALRYAERVGLIPKAPIIKGLRVPPTRVSSLTKVEAGRLIKAADDRDNWRERVYVRLALGTGARPGAIMELKWERVDKKISDFRSDHPLSHRMKRRAIVPINPMVQFALKLAAEHKKGPYVLHWHGRKMSSPRPLMKRLAKAAKIKGLTPHVLRHTVASLLLQEGVDPLKVSRLIGHANSRITEEVYFQHPPQWLVDTTSRLKF